MKPVSWTALGLVLLACAIGILTFDRPAAQLCARIPADAGAVLDVLTEAGNSKYSLIPAAILFGVCGWVVRRPRCRNAAAFLFVAVAGSGLLVNLIKMLLARLRPVALLEAGEYGFVFLKTGYRWASFPSGHANTLVALAVGLSLVAPRWRGLWWGLAVPLASTRVATCHHYPSDVIAGAYLAVVTTLVWERWLARKGWPVRPPAPAERGSDPAGTTSR